MRSGSSLWRAPAAGSSAATSLVYASQSSHAWSRLPQWAQPGPPSGVSSAAKRRAVLRRASAASLRASQEAHGFRCPQPSFMASTTSAAACHWATWSGVWAISPVSYPVTSKSGVDIDCPLYLVIEHTGVGPVPGVQQHPVEPVRPEGRFGPAYPVKRPHVEVALSAGLDGVRLYRAHDDLVFLVLRNSRDDTLTRNRVLGEFSVRERQRSLTFDRPVDVPEKGIEILLVPDCVHSTPQIWRSRTTRITSSSRLSMYSLARFLYVSMEPSSSEDIPNQPISPGATHSPSSVRRAYPGTASLRALRR